MKKHLLTISFVALSFFSALAQIPNPSFENWNTDYTVAESPDNWDFSNGGYEIMDAFLGSSTPTSLVKGPAHTGSFGLKLQNVQSNIPAVGTTTLPATAISYTFDVNGDAKHFPWSTRSAALTGYYQFNQGGSGVYPNIDTAVVLVGLYKWNATNQVADSIGGGILTFYITQSTYTSFSVPLVYFDGSVPDSAVITMASSYTQNPLQNTYLIVDDVAFSGIATGVNTPNFAAGKAPYAFPNPAKDQVSIGNVPAESARIEVRDVTGRVVLSSTAASNQTSFNLNGLKEGMYIYTILDSEGSILFNDKFAVSK